MGIARRTWPAPALPPRHLALSASPGEAERAGKRGHCGQRGPRRRRELQRHTGSSREAADLPRGTLHPVPALTLKPNAAFVMPLAPWSTRPLAPAPACTCPAGLTGPGGGRPAQALLGHSPAGVSGELRRDKPGVPEVPKPPPSGCTGLSFPRACPRRPSRAERGLPWTPGPTGASPERALGFCSASVLSGRDPQDTYQRNPLHLAQPRREPAQLCVCGQGCAGGGLSGPSIPWGREAQVAHLAGTDARSSRFTLF